MLGCDVVKPELQKCPNCNGQLVETNKIIKTQQVEIVEKPIIVTEHQQQGKNVMTFLRDCVTACTRNEKTPTLGEEIA